MIALSLLSISCLDPWANAEEQVERGRSAACTAERIHSGALPHALPVQEDLDYWVETWASEFNLDQPLLSAAEVSAHNIAVSVQRTTVGEVKSQEVQEAQEAQEAQETQEVKRFTRRAILGVLFSELKSSLPAGRSSAQASAQLITRVLGSLGIHQPESLSAQSEAGTFNIDLRQISSRAERVNVLNAAFRRGLTLIYSKDRALIYLGPDQSGRPRALHALLSYPEVCPGGEGETRVLVNRVVISDLMLGGESASGDLLTQAERITVIGGDPGPALRLSETGGLAAFRAPAPLAKPKRTVCRRARNRARIFTSPRSPHAKQPTRFMVTRPHRDTPAELKLYGPDGVTLTPQLKRLGGPPFIYYSEPIQLRRGQWRVAYGEADDLHACTHVEVTRRPQAEVSDSYIWEPSHEWSAHTEALFAGFVERLFQYPIEEDRTWTNLQDLLNVKDHNLLYDHFSAQEEAKLKLQPDCADLPYTLRAYFAWKLGLPFSYMTCTRGSKSKPPRCHGREDSHQERGRKSVGADFQWFARRRIAGHVHSSSARTVPEDNETELYPVALNHKTLRPGTVFADPYGHLLLIAGWLPQPVGGYGVLIGADAQPDGTIGRRRFWQGSFLFEPDHKLVGAGFKSFRPLVREGGSCEERDSTKHKRSQSRNKKNKNKKNKEKKNKKNKSERRCEREVSGSAAWRPVLNDELSDSRWGSLRWSDQQYRGSRRVFYDRMESLISPRPIAARVQLNALADALHESARRRVLSVNNGEQWMRDHPRRKMKMPSGYSIFLTTGPWEDFATPSRDMRLLIALDTVLDIPAAVQRDPKRFGIRPEGLEREITELKESLKSALSARTFEYTKSDGTSQTLSLWSLVERMEALEMAYNPNDCIEVRWGAPEGSAERATCKRAAPRSHRRKMKRYRPWFHERRRPPRGTR